MSWPLSVVRNLPIDASVFEASGNLGSEVCPGFHKLLVRVGEEPESDLKYGSFTNFDLASVKDIWIRIVGLPPAEPEASCSPAYDVHDPTPMSG